MIYRPAYCLPTPTSSPQGQVECPTSTAKTDKNELRARPYLHPPKEHEVKRQGGKDQDVQFVAHWRFPGRENPAGAGFVCFGTCSARFPVTGRGSCPCSGRHGQFRNGCAPVAAA